MSRMPRRCGEIPACPAIPWLLSRVLGNCLPPQMSVALHVRAASGLPTTDSTELLDATLCCFTAYICITAFSFWDSQVSKDGTRKTSAAETRPTQIACSSDLPCPAVTDCHASVTHTFTVRQIATSIYAFPGPNVRCSWECLRQTAAIMALGIVGTTTFCITLWVLAPAAYDHNCTTRCAVYLLIVRYVSRGETLLYIIQIRIGTLGLACEPNSQPPP
jgi:hypothetical protein